MRPDRRTGRRVRVRPVHYLNAFAPIALGLMLAGTSPSLVFFSSALAVVRAAAIMSEATQELSARSGAGVAGLLNVTFGNAPELIIAFFALLDGLQEVVKASLVGSVIGNSLLVLGAATRDLFAPGHRDSPREADTQSICVDARRRRRAGRRDERAARRLSRLDARGIALARLLAEDPVGPLVRPCPGRTLSQIVCEIADAL